MFTFDDGLESLYDEAYTYMASKGLNKGTGYVIGNSVGAGGYISWAEALEMNAAGWDIANHSQTHANFTTLTQAEIETEITDCQTAIESNVGSRGSKHVAYPFGGHDADVDAAMAATGMLTGRDVGGVSFSPDDPPDYRYITSVPVNESTDLGNIKILIEEAVRNKKALVLLFHGVVEIPAGPHISITKFRELVDWVSSKGYQLSSISDLYDLAYG